MATKKTVTKKVAKPVKKVVPVKKSQPAKKAVPVKAATKKVVKPIAKPATKKVASVKPVVKATKKAVKKVVPVKKSQPAKKTAPVKSVVKIASKPVAKKTASKAVAKKVDIKKKSVPVKPTPKKVVAKPVAKVERKPKAKEILKSKAVDKTVAPAKSVGAVYPEASVQKSMKKTETKLKKKKLEVIAKMPTKQAKPTPKKSAAKLFTKPSGIEKSTTIIPMKQLPMRKKEEPIKEVKIPKTSIKTSVPYNPVYTPLEKRVEVSKPSEPLVKYSDSELNEFRELINKKIDAAKKELSFLQGSITRKDDMGGDSEDGRYMTMEDGSLSMEREQLSQMASRQITYIDHLEKALMRIENKTYGICRVTGKLIDKARLRAVPHATLSLEAKLGLVKLPSAD